MAKTSLLHPARMLVLSTFLLVFACGEKGIKEPTDIILAKIGERTISRNEFIRRAEYTIRPPYCHHDNYIHRKIILNSLIAEKLFAIAAGEDNELAQNKRFQAFLNGRKEQAMRLWQYQQVAYNKVKLDTSEIKRVFRLAGRKYQLAFFHVENDTLARLIQNDLNEHQYSFEEINEKYFGQEKIPEREVSWEEEQDEAIYKALFSEPLQKDQIIGPIKTEDGASLFMHVRGWTDRVVISDQEIQQRWKDVSERLRRQKAAVIYREYAANLMQGKEARFSRDTFFKLAEFLAPVYIKTPEEEQQAFTNQMWKQQPPEISAEVYQNLEAIKDFPLLQLDGETWTVEKLLDEMNRHPLVFRKRKFSYREFPQQLKLAIADLIRDRFLTQAAYQAGYNQVNVVQRDYQMWRDNLYALFHRENYLRKSGVSGKSYLQEINNYLNAYVDSLQSKYSPLIEINVEEFEKIQLTRIDLFVMQTNVPYPVVVPGFPLLTTDTRLDYGRKME